MPLQKQKLFTKLGKGSHFIRKYKDTFYCLKDVRYNTDGKRYTLKEIHPCEGVVGKCNLKNPFSSGCKEEAVKWISKAKKIKKPQTKAQYDTKQKAKILKLFAGPIRNVKKTDVKKGRNLSNEDEVYISDKEYMNIFEVDPNASSGLKTDMKYIADNYKKLRWHNVRTALENVNNPQFDNAYVRVLWEGLPSQKIIKSPIININEID